MSPRQKRNTLINYLCSQPVLVKNHVWRAAVSHSLCVNERTDFNDDAASLMDQTEETGTPEWTNGKSPICILTVPPSYLRSWGECRRWSPGCRPRCRSREKETGTCERLAVGAGISTTLCVHYVSFVILTCHFTFVFVFLNSRFLSVAVLRPERVDSYRTSRHYFHLVPCGKWWLFFFYTYSKVYSDSVTFIYLHTGSHLPKWSNNYKQTHWEVLLLFSVFVFL